MMHILVSLVLCLGSAVTPADPALQNDRRFKVTPDAPFMYVAGLARDDDGSLYVSDRLDYRLKHLDVQGRLLQEVGGRGKGPGQFAGPGPVAVIGDVVAVADFSNSRVQLFDAFLRYRGEWCAQGSVIDLQSDPAGSLWVATYSGKQSSALAEYSRTGDIIRTLSLHHVSGNFFHDLFCFTITRAGRIVVVYYVQNMVEEWTVRGDFVREYSLGGVPLVAPSVPVSSGFFTRQSQIPADILFRSVTSDPAGNILILSGAYAEHPGRDLIVIGPDGRRRDDIVLPAMGGQIIAGTDESLTVSEEQGTRLSKYILKLRRPR